MDKYGRSGFVLAVAGYVNADHTELVRASARSVLSGPASGQALSATVVVAEGAPPTAKAPVKGKGPLTLFQLDRAAAVGGRRGGKFKAGYWAQLRKEYDELPTDLKNAYEDRSRSSKLAAVQARQTRLEATRSGGAVARGALCDSSSGSQSVSTPSLPKACNLLQMASQQAVVQQQDVAQRGLCGMISRMIVSDEACAEDRYFGMLE